MLIFDLFYVNSFVGGEFSFVSSLRFQLFHLTCHHSKGTTKKEHVILEFPSGVNVLPLLYRRRLRLFETLFRTKRPFSLVFLSEDVRTLKFLLGCLFCLSLPLGN